MKPTLDSSTHDEIFKLKRKWQIALRRYVLEQKACPTYARYFGLPFTLFREWIATQFDNTTNWDNFSLSWQFDHIVPLAYFDFKDQKDLELCWNFINIRIEKLDSDRSSHHRVDVIAAKAYFQHLLARTGYYQCHEMIRKIDAIEVSQLQGNDSLEAFIRQHLDTLNDLTHFTDEDFERINLGMAVAEIIAEKKLFAKFGM